MNKKTVDKALYFIWFQQNMYKVTYVKCQNDVHYFVFTQINLVLEIQGMSVRNEKITAIVGLFVYHHSSTEYTVTCITVSGHK